MTPPDAAHDGPCLLLDLQALADNWRTVCAACPASRVGAVVKGDAYGLGVAQIVPTLWELGCRDFWLATADEALRVRACLPGDAPACGLRLWLLDGLGGHDARDLAGEGLIPALAGPHEAALLGGDSSCAGAPLPVAVHLDTGLSRLGFGARDLALLQPRAELWRVARPLLWLTHLGRFHDPEAPQCLHQRELFLRWTAQLPPAARSIATSSSVFAGPGWHFDHVRAGSALWGVPTSVRVQAPLRPVAHLHAPVLRVAEVEAGTEIGYAGNHVTDRARRIATIALGYGDGLPFGLVNRGQLIVAGRSASIVGGVAMGMLALDVSDFALGEVRPGQWVEVYGARQPLATLAAAAGVAPNVLLMLTSRLARRRVARAAAPVAEPAL